MLKISYRYSNGQTGTCIENGQPIVFQDEAAAQAFADEFNNGIDEEVRAFFPVWYVEAI
jgi:hypothetical protein